ncbi:TPA_asm: MFS transporter [Salmonella enterica]|nr:MFS transporter [Salmonella enterica]EAO7619061.1 MFS transporter [Salmonella enterica]EAQ6819691.1 MFS transporter [Salmonella enterica]HAC8240055.1 MFS transporter [Salmonella enterica]HAC8273581.1 MFS transporter [Salmonella enterica]
MNNQRVGILEKIGYGMGDAGCNIVGGAVFLFLNYYYTDVYGLTAATVAAIWLGVRVIEAVSDPLIGMLADRTRTRWGKFRPYILFFAFPYAILCVLMFTVPDFSYTGKVVYAFATYLFMSITYSFINIPYCSLGSVISYNDQDRVSCQSYRFMGVGVATLILTTSLLPMVQILGKGDQALGYQRAVSILTCVGLVLFIFCFKLVRERVVPVIPKNNDSLLNDLKDILKNDQWIKLLLLTFTNVLPGFIRMAATLYFLTYVVKADNSFITTFMSIGVVGMIIGSALAKPLSDRFCKLKIFFWISVFLFLWSAGMYFIDPEQRALLTVAYFILNIVHQIAQPINWSIMSDVDDYGEWKTGKRLTGINFSCNFLALKIGLAISGALVSSVLAWSHYHGGQPQQTETTLTIIKMSFFIMPAVGYLLTAGCVRLLRVDHSTMLMVFSELNKRRKNYSELTDYIAAEEGLMSDTSVARP